MIIRAAKDKWVPIKPYDVVLRMIARASSRVFIGQPVCRDEAWLEASMTFTASIFETVGILRAFPGFLHPVVSIFLPSCWRLKRQLMLIKELVVPIIIERRAAESLHGTDYEKPDDFLQWMMDLAKNDSDRDPGNLAHRLLGIISMAVVHTSAMAVVHVLYDLITMPEYQEPLRTELQQTLPQGWGNLTHNELVKLTFLDSFLKESQRMNPPGHRKHLIPSVT